MKKYIGYLLWVLGFAIPFQSALLSTEEVGNVKGLVSFIVMMALVFAGYLLVDSATAAQHGGGDSH